MRLTNKGVVVLALAVLAALLAACDSGGDSAGQGQEQTPTSTTIHVPEGAVPAGRFLALAGEESLDAGLYELRFGPLRLDRLTPTRRVGAVGACEKQVVVAAAQEDVGFSDTVQRFTAGKLGPVEGLGNPKGSSPTLHSDCRMAYVVVDRSTPENVFRLHLWDPQARTDTVIHSAGALGGFSFGPHGEIAVIETTKSSPGQVAASTAIVIIVPGQPPRSMPAPAPDLGVLRWGASARIAISRTDAKTTLFLDPDTGDHSELPGWYPLGWSPDGSELLVSNAGEFRTLGVVLASDLSEVRTLGRTEVGIYEVAWLPPSATPDQGG